MSIEFHIIDIVCNTAEYLCALLFFNNFLKVKVLRKRYFVIAGCVFVSLFTIINMPLNIFLNIIGAFALISCAALFLCRGNIVCKLAFAVVYIALAVFAESGMAFLYYGAKSISFIEIKDNFLAYAFTAIFGKTILCLLIFYITRKFNHRHTFGNSRYTATLAVFPMLGVVTILILASFSNTLQLTTLQNLTFSLLSLGLLSASIAAFFIYNSAMQKKELENQLAMSQKIHQMNEILFKEQQRSMETGRRYIHDFKNHLQNIRALYQNDNTQAIDYEEKLISRLDRQAPYQLIDVNNYVISNIFERVRQQCEMDNIVTVQPSHENKAQQVKFLLGYHREHLINIRRVLEVAVCMFG